ncbi:hypothetical protein ACHAXH_003944 [Discostella pseudostelligera]
MKASILLVLLPSMGPSDAGAGFVTNLHPVTMSPSSALTMELPKPENWAPFKLGKFKKDERQLNKKKQHFQSRPLVDFQKDLEAGKVRHLFPVMFAKQRVQMGELRPSDIPYEQREGGTWTNKDVNVGYVPSGMSVHEWHDFKRAENKQTKNKNFAAIGPTSFKSRSLQGFQEDLEKGKANHLFPAMFAKEQIKRGQLKQEDVPYMQRLGSWDDSDVKGAKKKEWSETDKRMESKKSSWLRMRDTRSP